MLLMTFLSGLAAVVFMGVVVLTIKWLKEKIQQKLNKNKGHKVVFADMQDIIDDVIKGKVNNTTPMSLDELESMCSETPYVIADYDSETDTVSEYEGFQASEVEKRVDANLKANDGMIVVAA